MSLESLKDLYLDELGDLYDGRNGDYSNAVAAD